MQTNGVPTGPPGPQLQDEASFSPNRSTLLMNPGDRLKIRIFDNKAAGALETSVQDLTTGRTGSQMQFLTDNPATNSECGPTATAAWVVPPPQAPGGFHPYWTLAAGRAAGQHGGGCVWEFGQMTNGDTFGGDAQYGPPTVLSQIINLGVMDESPIMPIPDCAGTGHGHDHGHGPQV